MRRFIATLLLSVTVVAGCQVKFDPNHPVREKPLFPRGTPGKCFDDCGLVD